MPRAPVTCLWFSESVPASPAGFGAGRQQPSNLLGGGSLSSATNWLRRLCSSAPIIGADEHNLRSQLVAEDSDPPPKRFDGCCRPAPNPAGDAGTDSENHKQVTGALGILD